jgi:hypothetical protein
MIASSCSDALAPVHLSSNTTLRTARLPRLFRQKSRSTKNVNGQTRATVPANVRSPPLKAKHQLIRKVDPLEVELKVLESDKLREKARR